MNKTIKAHIQSVKELNEIKELCVQKLKENTTEKEISSFILKEYKKKGLKTQNKPPIIVSFGKSTAEIHHFPKNLKLKNGLIMIDAWAKQKNGCYADLTWMFCKGNPCKKEIYCFNELVKSRNSAINFIKRCLKDKYLPTMFEIDSISRAYLAEKRLGYAFQHRIGHGLGKKVHDGTKKEYYERIKLNKPYTIEPGIYLKEFGIRLENDFWIDEKFKMHTTEIQNKLILI
jgi:Xaa-Pro aminopeptidase